MADNKTQIIIAAKDETRAAFQSVQSSLAGLEKSAIGLGPIFAGLGAALSLGAFAQTITNTIKFAAALDDMAEATGASVENLSALSAVAKIGGHDLGAVESGLQKLAKSLHGTGEESKGAAAALEALGLSAEELRGKDTAEAMLDVAKALDQFKDGSGKAAAAQALLGKSGAALLPFLKDLAEQSELVGKVTAEQAAQAEAYEKNLNRLSASFGAAGRAAAYELLPFLEKLTGEMVRARDESGSFASVFGDGVRTALEAVAVLGVNVVYVFKQVGNEIGGIAAQIAALTRLDFKSFNFIGDAMKEDAKKARAEVDRLSADLLDRTKKTSEAAVIKPTLAFKAPEEKIKVPRASGGRSSADEAARLIQQLNEQIALKGLDAESTDKLTAAEQQRANVLYQLDAGTLKASASQREKITAALDELVVLDRTLQAQKEFAAGVERQTQANLKGRDAMREQAAEAERATELYGLNESQISAVEQARLADAIAMAKQNGASEDQIAYLEEELRLRSALTDALIGKQTKANEIEEAKKAIEAVSELDEFTKSAAKNMQSAFADFLFDPFAEGADKMAQKFGETVKRMIAEAASAELMKLLLGDYATNGKTGDKGLIGGLFSAAGSIDWADLFGFADGGIMTSNGPVPLRKYASGGIANSAQFALFGEGSTPEAYVPLPDGRRIPVQMAGGGDQRPVVINVNSQTGDPAEIRRAAASGARTAMGFMNGARRYG